MSDKIVGFHGISELTVLILKTDDGKYIWETRDPEGDVVDTHTNVNGFDTYQEASADALQSAHIILSRE